MCLKSGDILRDRYQIINKIGEGGSAITYKAVDLHEPGENPLCVVKEIRPPQSTDPRVWEGAQQLFEKEARTLKLLGDHPRIPAFIEHFYQDNSPFYIVQEYIEGHPLQQEFIPNHRWREEQVIELLRDILEILTFLHKNNVIHRDITPSNLIRRNSDEKIVLIDFGAVKEIGTIEITASGRTRTTTIGTPGYSAPEQLNGQPRLCSDIYSVGLIAIQFLTGVHPRELPQDPRTGEIIWNYSLPNQPMLHVNQRLANVLNKMVRYHFNHRYQSATKVLGHLDAPPLPWKWLSIAIALVAAGAIAIHYNSIFSSKTRLVFGDGLSAGEEILFTSSKPRLKQRGVSEFADSNSKEAFNLFKKSWQQEYGKDPETLVYMNNAFLDANKIPYYTISVAIPIGSKKPDSPTHLSDQVKEVLRGVAQAQTEVNLRLSNSSNNNDFPDAGFLQGKAINGKGLKVILADDANDGEEAKQKASLLVNQPDILAVIGHTNSEMTIQTVDIYNKNNLVLMSSGSATEELTDEPRKFFFRTQYTSSLIAKSLGEHLIAKNQKQAAILYNQANAFGSSFNEEFKKYFESQGGKIIRIRDFDLSKKDFNAQRAMKEIEAQGETAIALVPDAHVTNSLNNAFEIMKINQDRNWIVGAWTLMCPQTLEIAFQSQQKLFKKFISSVGWHPLSSINKEFPQQARSLWGGEVNTRTASAYDATRALIKALEMQPKPNREGMQKMLSSPNFTAYGATGTIQFDSPKNGDRKNPTSDLVHIVKCEKEQFGLTFVPVKYATAAAAGLKCD